MKEGFCQAFVFKLIELFAPLLSSVQKAVSSFGAENTIETFFHLKETFILEGCGELKNAGGLGLGGGGRGRGGVVWKQRLQRANIPGVP